MLADTFLALALACAHVYTPGLDGIPIYSDELRGQFLLQISYEHDRYRLADHFMTSRSRIVEFIEREDALVMVDVSQDSSAPRFLARIPISSESSEISMLDFNTGFDRIFLEEDRTGEDYYGRTDQQDYSGFFRLFERRLAKAFHAGSTLVLEQRAVDNGGSPVVVHYYLSPYQPNPQFTPFEMENLDSFGLYETYPQQRGQETILYATKFDIRKPVVFALSSKIPSRHRQAARDGVLYWNKAFGSTIVRVVDAPEQISAPHPQYNVIEWEVERGHASTSHIQTDPLTGEILHAHIFLLPSIMTDDLSSDAYNNHLRYLVAHEVGHALGLRHNFAEGPISTVMNYFSYAESVRIGREIISERSKILAYDQSVIRKVYLGEPLDFDTMPAFCTDYQEDCGPPWRRNRNLGAATSIHAGSN